MFRRSGAPYTLADNSNESYTVQLPEEDLEYFFNKILNLRNMNVSEEELLQHLLILSNEWQENKNNKSFQELNTYLNAVN